MGNLKQNIFVGFVILIIFAVFVWFSNQLKAAKEGGINQEKVECQQQIIKQTNEIIKYQKIYVEKKARIRAIGTNDKFKFLCQECRDCQASDCE